jgi:drug/metabolite transporter (DMT)-like permease
MSPGTYALVVLSAVAHAYWNFLLKRAGGSQSVVGLSKVAEAALLGPLLLAAGAPTLARVLAAWPLPVVGALLVLVNYVLLAAAYRHGDLSLVYPVSRGAILAFLPPLAYVTVGERLDAVGWMGLAAIVAGIACVQLPSFDAGAVRAWGRSLRAPATAYALFAALVAACYTVWDKRAVQVLSPLSYFAAYTVLVAAVYGAVLRAQAPAGALGGAWRAHRGPIVQIAVLNSGSYLLALAALQTGKASYVIALRQLSIAAGALLGWRLLGEVLAPPRRVGVAMVVAGCALLALAR